MAGRTAAWMRVGEVDIAPVWDGTLLADIASVLLLPRAETERLVAAAGAASGEDPLVLPVRGFALRHAGRIALVDVGSGKAKGASMGFLLESLALLGITPDSVEAVLLTHMHMDHIGGLVDDAGQAVFAHAEIVLSQREAQYFLDTPEMEVDARSRRHLGVQRAIIGAYGSRVRRVEAGDGWGPVRARPAAGHTPGHIVWEIEADGAGGLIIGDVVHLAAVQLPRPRSAMIYDVDAEMAAATRVALLENAAQRGLLVAGAHLPGTGLGRFIAAGAGYAFQEALEL